jgi:hypothetical protein
VEDVHTLPHVVRLSVKIMLVVEIARTSNDTGDLRTIRTLIKGNISALLVSSHTTHVMLGKEGSGTSNRPSHHTGNEIVAISNAIHYNRL